MSVIDISAFSPAGATGARVDRPDKHFSRLLKPLPGFALVNSQTQPAYREASDYVAASFKRHYGATLSHFMPWLMTMHCMGGVSGVAGLRPAATGPLFLEQYLDAPLEDMAAAKGIAIDRARVVEIGNLVAQQRGASQLVFLILTNTLLAAGHEWLAFTATTTLRNTLKRLDFPLIEMGGASLDRLPESEREHWGRYYNASPRVVMARLDSVNDITARRPLLRHALSVYDAAIAQMAESLFSGR